MGGIQGYQAGSTFKAFTAAAALEKGIPLSKKYNAKHSMNFGGKSFRSCEGREQIFGNWKVTNSTTSGDQVMGMYEAAQNSVNTYFAQLELDVGMCPTIKMAEKLGVKLGTRDRDWSTTTSTSRPSPSAPSRSARCRWPRRTRPSPPAASTATRPSSRRSSTATARNSTSEGQLPAGDERGRCRRDEQAAGQRGHQGHRAAAPRPPTADRRRARPARSTATRPSGTSATPRRSPGRR